MGSGWQGAGFARGAVVAALAVAWIGFGQVGCEQPPRLTVPGRVAFGGKADAGAAPQPDASSAGDPAIATDAGSGPSVATVTGTTPMPPPALCQMSLRCDGEIPDDPKITCTFSVVDGEGVTVFDDHAGVELHGRSSLEFPKKNYSIELHDAAGANKPTDLLGMGQESDWILDGMWADRSLMRNALIFDAFRRLGGLHYAAAGRYCALTLNDEPAGIYRLEEKIKRDANRVAISADDGTGSSFVIKQETGGVANLLIGQEPHWKIVYPNQDQASSGQIAGVQSWLDALGNALDNPNAPEGGLLTLLDRDAAVDWVLFQELMKNIDGYAVSIYFSRDGGRPARLIPWDFDLSLGQPTVQNDPNVPPNDRPGGWISHPTQLTRALAAVPAITQALGPRWRALRAGPLATGALLAQLDGYGVTLTPDAISQNFAIWPLGQIDYTDINPPYSLYPVSSYADEAAKLRAYLAARLDWIDAHIDVFRK